MFMSKWHRLSALLCILLLVCSCGTACAETLRFQQSRIEFDVPESWLCMQKGHVDQTAEKMGVSSEELSAMLTGDTAALLFYPGGGRYDPAHYVQLDLTPMESYHQDFSGLTENALGNIGKSYLKNGAYESWELYRTDNGLTFLKLLPGQPNGSAYTTHENTVRLTITLVGADIPQEAEQALLRLVNTIRIGEPGPDLPSCSIDTGLSFSFPLRP